MIYLLYGTKTFLIKEDLKKICGKFDNLNISRYDLNIDSFADIINDCQTVSLFNDKKLICENDMMFTGLNSKDSEIIESYLNNVNPDTTLIFTVYSEKLDERKKITKLIKKMGKIKEYNENINPYSLANNLLKDYKVDTKFLVDRVGENPFILEEEIKKLKLYKDDNIITKEDILNVTVKKVDTNIFAFLDAIVLNNKSKAIEMYHEMLKQGEEPIKLIVRLANNFRIMYQAKGLLMRGLTEKDIASTLKAHPYTIKLAIKNGQKYSGDTLLNYISELADMDINIKTGKIDKNLALELFILKK